MCQPLGELPDPLPVPVPVRARGQAPIALTIRPPGSKSLTNRALLLAALGEGESVLHAPLLGADDAERMLAAIGQLGAGVLHDSEPRASARAGCKDETPSDSPLASHLPCARGGEHEKTPSARCAGASPVGTGEGVIRVRGVGGRWRVPDGGITLDLGGSGTASRFLAASALLATGPITIDGNARLRERPIDELGELLTALGARIEYLGEPGCPPMRITAPEGNRPAIETVEIGPTQSSQFISALLLVAPFLPDGLTLKLTAPPTSGSYVRMTTGLLDRLGVRVRSSGDGSILRVLPGLGRFDYRVEPDASGAGYWYATGALLRDANIRVVGAGGASLQGDARFPDLLAQMGCTIGEGESHGAPTLRVRAPEQLRPIICDMSDMPDAVMTLASVAAFTPGTTIIRGVRTLRVKETDRIAALQAELGKIGVVVESELNGDPDALSITPPARGVDCSGDAPRVEFDTYDDHRMAMSLALIGLRRPNVCINDPGCIAKTYPSFWAEWARLYE